MPVETGEFTVVKRLWPDAKIRYGRVKVAEGGYLSLDDPNDLKDIEEGKVYVFSYLKTDKGYRNNGKVVGAGTGKPMPSTPKPRLTQPDPTGDIRGTMGMANGVLNACFYGMPLHRVVEYLEEQPDLVPRLIGILHTGLMRSSVKGKQVQSAPDLNDQIPFP